MSDEGQIDPNTDQNPDNNTQGEQSNEDPLKNVKSEFNRKLESLQEQMRQNNENITQVLQSALNKPQPQSAPADDENIDDLMYDNPAKYRELLKKQITEEVTGHVSKQQEQTQRQQQEVSQVISTMQQRFPEYADPQSNLSKKAVEIYNNLPNEVQSNTVYAYEKAMAEAAMELGVLPASKRRQVDDDFTLSGGGRQVSRERSKSGKGQVNKNTELFSQLLGRDTNDPKVKERLQEASQRKNWSRYKPFGGGQ